MHNLNSPQCKAVTTASRSKLVLIQGPPGTGKTTVLRGLAHLYATSCPGDRSLLLAGRNNSTVDNLVGGIADPNLPSDHPLSTVKSVRAGNVDRVSPAASAITFLAHYRRCYPDAPPPDPRKRRSAPRAHLADLPRDLRIPQCRRPDRGPGA